MTIDEAIKVLEGPWYPTTLDEWMALYKAINLGIEALREVKESRFDPGTWTPHTLPGETP